MSRPSALAVVIPARDEEELLPGCLDSVADAVAALGSTHPEIDCRVFVVLDSCQDASAAVVARRSQVTALTVRSGCVGAARAAGVEAAAAWASRLARRPLWLACTDADTTVPRPWLVAQVTMATAGHDLVVGTVRPVSGELTPHELGRWWDQHTLTDGHGHVHGANLGFSLASYRLVGGFRPLPAHEDADLVSAMRRVGVAWVATGDVPVVTSGRRKARAPDGFAAYLDGLGA